MKYYFPTTTLNFDSIVSSQVIAPAGMYRQDTLWWNRFESILGQRRDALVLFSKIPIWAIDDPDRDNYPLVIEFDESVFKAIAGEELALGKGLKALVITVPIAFAAQDVERGNVRFFFRTPEEMDRMLNKVSVGVCECKVMPSIRLDSPEAFSFLSLNARGTTFRLSSVEKRLDAALSRISTAEDLGYSRESVREERERGAALGYRVGRYVKSLRFGSFVDAFRIPLSYPEWKDGVLPRPFASVLDNLCARPAQEAWNPNREAIVAFCRDRWIDCFEGNEIEEGNLLHKSFQSIEAHLLSPEVEYRFANWKDPCMQAFAAFLECGDQAAKYPRYAKSPLLKSPEYLFALYGALVGYTFFSRVLLDNKMYAPDLTPPVANDGRMQPPSENSNRPKPWNNSADVAGRAESVSVDKPSKSQPHRKRAKKSAVCRQGELPLCPSN